MKDPDQQDTDLGIVSVGGDVARTVPVINRSAKAVKFRIEPRNAENFAKSALSLKPSGTDVVLKPKEQLPLEIRFRPKARMPDFEHEIMLVVDGVEEERTLLSVRGVAHGIELKIMDEVLGFGNVVKDSRLTKTLQMSNFGDVKANFAWDAKNFSRNFTISPAKGYVNPNSNLDLEVTFHPKSVDQDLRQRVTCEVTGGEPITLTMMGKCVAQEGSQTQELKFQTVVRKATTQTVAIQNPEDKEWAINPTISTQSDACKGYYAGKATFVVPAKGTANYEVTYLPKTMTTKEKEAPDSENMVDVPHQEASSSHFPTAQLCSTICLVWRPSPRPRDSSLRRSLPRRPRTSSCQSRTGEGRPRDSTLSGAWRATSSQVCSSAEQTPSMSRERATKTTS